MSRRDPYYKSPDGYDAYQWRELIKREIKNGKVYSTYKCSNLGGEVDIFTTEFPLDERSTLDKILDEIDDLKNQLSDVAQLRREEMLHLYQMFGEKGDKSYWCS